jgi:hypothetical protein
MTTLRTTVTVEYEVDESAVQARCTQPANWQADWLASYVRDRGTPVGGRVISASTEVV